MAEFQYGNIPGTDPFDQSSLYDRLNLSYSYKSLNLYTRIEQYYPSFGDNKSYTRLSQYRVQYNAEKLKLTVGHMYTTLGKGLLLRTYEIPGSIWETRGYRVRYGFYKDLHGIEAVYRIRNFEVKALRGRLLDVALPPTLDKDIERRPDLVEGGEIKYSFQKHKTGIIFLRQTNEGVSSNYTSIEYEGNLGKNISLVGEFAFGIDSSVNVFSFSDTSAYGIYTGITYTGGSFGVSVEFKNYRNMSIGSGISDPPTLVKENSYRLLNRSTHVPILTDESGYQVELYYRFQNGGMITLNHALAKNEISQGNAPVFKELFAEFWFPVENKNSGRIFADYSSDPLVNENNRYTTGFEVEIVHSRLNSDLTGELQYAERKIAQTVRFINVYAGYTLSFGSRFSIAIVVEATDDPVHLETNQDWNYYPSLTLNYRPDNHNRISVFGGKRRGGPACNSGVCYNVLDFEGIEIRLTSRF